jgi:hypothetical protein
MASVDCTPESSGAFRQMAMPIDPRAMILSLANIARQIPELTRKAAQTFFCKSG